jgi:transketolase
MKFYEKDLREVFGETLVELGRDFPRMVVLDADLNTSTRTILFAQRYPARFIQCGIAESNMFGVAGGLAAEGFIPHVSTFATFACKKAADQVYMNAAYPKLNVKIPGSYPGMTATECGPSHNVAEDLAIMRAMPHMQVFAFGDNEELASGMRVLTETPGPMYYRVPKIKAPVLFSKGHTFKIGKGYVLGEGEHLTLLGTGMTTGICLAAATLLARAGIHATVLHMPSIKPIDAELIEECARKTSLLVTVENHRIHGGFGSAVSEVLAARYPARVERIGLGEDVFESAPLAHLLRHYQLTPAAVAKRARAALDALNETVAR